MAGLSSSWRKDRHYLNVSASAFRANEIEQPGNVNEDRFVGKLDFIKGQLRPVAAFNAPAMNREAGFARRSGIGYRLGWLAARHGGTALVCFTSGIRHPLPTTGISPFRPYGAQ